MGQEKGTTKSNSKNTASDITCRVGGFNFPPANAFWQVAKRLIFFLEAGTMGPQGLMEEGLECRPVKGTPSAFMPATVGLTMVSMTCFRRASERIGGGR